jgi:AraC-like DNA-binding protein
MVFNLREDELRIYGPAKLDHCRRFTGAATSGPYAGSFMSDTAEEAAIMGVHFKPGGAFAVLETSAGEFANTHVDLRTIWGPEATTLREQLCALNEPMERFRLLERALMDRLYERPHGHDAVRVALNVLVRTHGQMRVRDIARAVDLSRRRLVEVFTAEVGLTPKLFGQIQRFQRTVARSRNTAKMDWAQLAAECGYFDQSHLIHEFVEFSGVTPSEYWRLCSQLARAGIHVKRHHLPLAG